MLITPYMWEIQCTIASRVCTPSLMCTTHIMSCLYMHWYALTFTTSDTQMHIPTTATSLPPSKRPVTNSLKFKLQKLLAQPGNNQPKSPVEFNTRYPRCHIQYMTATMIYLNTPTYNHVQVTHASDHSPFTHSTCTGLLETLMSTSSIITSVYRPEPFVITVDPII